MNPHLTRQCFGCNVHGLNGTVVSGGPGGVGMRFSLSAQHQSASGIAHGGVIAAMLDEALGFAVWQPGKPCATAHLQTWFLRPAEVPGEYLVRTGPFVIDGRKISISARAYNDNGEAVAKAEALFVYLKDDQK